MAIFAQEAVHVPQELIEAIIAHAREGKPEEICGIIRGRGLVAVEVIRGTNIAEERIDNYEVDPQTLLKQFKFEDAGDSMMGIYHSHPVSVAYPSATDAWNAHYPDSIYFICSLEDDAVPVVRAFRMITHFLEQAPQPVAQALPFYETRPGLFAYYVTAESQLPATLAGVDEALERPFYLVYHLADGQGESELGADLRAVALIEYPIVIGD